MAAAGGLIEVATIDFGGWTIMQRGYLGICAAMLLAWSALPAWAGVGFQSVAIPDPGGPPIEVGIWYPSDAPSRPVSRGLSTQDLAVDGAPAGTRLPLVVMSHGNGGSYGGHYDTALALAKAGFVVAALTHTGDNYKDQSQASNMAERPRQLKVLIDHMLTAWPSHGAIDPGRVGAFGFSSGGFTVLAAAGAEPDFSGQPAHCRAHPAFYDCVLMAAHPSPKAPGPWTHDARIKAIVSAAPAVGWSLTPRALAGVKVPVQLWRAENDEVLPNPFYAEAVRRALPRPPEFHVVPGATHFTFLAPCSPAARAAMGRLCDDPPGVDRNAVHADFNSEVVRFFQAKLP